MVIINERFDRFLTQLRPIFDWGFTIVSPLVCIDCMHAMHTHWPIKTSKHATQCALHITTILFEISCILPTTQCYLNLVLLKSLFVYYVKAGKWYSE